MNSQLSHFLSRTIPELELVGDTSLMSILRWNFKNNMNKTMSASDKGQITLVGFFDRNNVC